MQQFVWVSNAYRNRNLCSCNVNADQGFHDRMDCMFNCYVRVVRVVYARFSSSASGLNRSCMRLLSRNFCTRIVTNTATPTHDCTMSPTSMSGSCCSRRCAAGRRAALRALARSWARECAQMRINSNSAAEGVGKHPPAIHTSFSARQQVNDSHFRSRFSSQQSTPEPQGPMQLAGHGPSAAADVVGTNTASSSKRSSGRRAAIGGGS